MVSDDQARSVTFVHAQCLAAPSAFCSKSCLRSAHSTLWLCTDSVSKHHMVGMQANKLIKSPDHDLPAHDDNMIGIALNTEDTFVYEAANEEWWSIAVLMPWGEMQPLTLRTDWKVHQMKELIQALMGVCCQDQQLTYAGKQLPSYLSILEADLRDGCHVNVVIQPCKLSRSPSLVQLIIKQLKEAPCPVWVNSKHTVGQLKELLQLVLGPHHQDQRLMFAGQQLMSEFKLHDYGLKDGYTVYLLIRRVLPA